MTDQEWRDNVYLSNLDRYDRGTPPDNEASGPLAIGAFIVFIGVVLFGIAQVAVLSL